MIQSLSKEYFRFFLKFFERVPDELRLKVLTFILQDLIELLQIHLNDKEVWLAYLKKELCKLGLYVDKL